MSAPFGAHLLSMLLKKRGKRPVFYNASALPNKLVRTDIAFLFVPTFWAQMYAHLSAHAVPKLDIYSQPDFAGLVI